MLSAASDGNAYRFVIEEMRAGRLRAGRWVATFPGGERIEIEAAP